MEVDWGGKIEANHGNECMVSEVDWGAYDNHTSGYMLSQADWEPMTTTQVMTAL